MTALFDCFLKVETVEKTQGKGRLREVRGIAERMAAAQELELVEVALQKEPDGMALTIYIDKDGGVTLNDCERFHKAVQPLLADVDYDYLEVSSPGADRPVQTQRDFEKHRGDAVEVKLFAKIDGVKLFTGALDALDDNEVAIITADGARKTFPRKAVALVRPVIHVAEE